MHSMFLKVLENAFDLNFIKKLGVTNNFIDHSNPNIEKQYREEFETLIKSHCSYCNKPPSNLHKKILHYNGLDRKDNNQGYSINNTIPCCKTCNLGKHNLQYEEWIKHLTNLVQFRLKLLV